MPPAYLTLSTRLDWLLEAGAEIGATSAWGDVAVFVLLREGLPSRRIVLTCFVRAADLAPVLFAEWTAPVEAAA